MSRAVTFLTSTLASSLRGWQGINSRTDATMPEQLLELYDIENCPYCRIVREVLTQLDLDAMIYPCPKGGERYRAQLRAIGGKELFPYLVDPGAGVEMNESADIIRYLFKQYGDGIVPLQWRFTGLQKASSALASAARAGRGMHALPSTEPEIPLELYSFEASPFARPVRELLCQMEIPYILRSCGRSTLGEWLPPRLRERLEVAPESSLHNRVALLEKEGRQGIPYLWDPNTEQGMFESEEILTYIKARYA
jgi:glutathione S-transferase